MSRFQNPSPRPERTESRTSSTAAEDEIIKTILKKRDQRLPPRRTSHDGSPRKKGTESVTSRDSDQSRTMNDSTPRGVIEQKVLPTKTPYNLLKRLARAEYIKGDLPEDGNSIAESYPSHTSSSINEASALLGHGDIHTLFDSPRAFSPFVDRSAISKLDSNDSQVFERDSVIAECHESRAGSREESKSERNTLFTPKTTQERPRSREVANGYISPPQSRQTSPELLFTAETPIHSTSGILRSIMDHDSPSPGSVRKHSPLFQPKVAVPQVERTQVLQNVSNSPRSRLTRTLLEIQSELAESREGIESIESRLGVLEKHSSVSGDMLRKHVEDCVRNMAEELDVSGELSRIAQEVDESQVDVDVDDADMPVSQEEKTDLRLQEDGHGTVLRIPMTVKMIVYGIVGALATEWVVMSVLSELGRRKILFVT